MEIRNLTEDAVSGLVDELFETETADRKLGYCTCGQCRLDVVCYVLNRLPPEYVVSSRGVAWSERDPLGKVQRRADIMSLAKEGWSRVSHQPRPTADHSASRLVQELPPGPAFNFPTIVGKVLVGANFEPLAEGKVLLLLDGKPALMADSNWQNPYVLAKATAGSYSFRILPAAAAKEGEEGRFSCELRVEAPGLEPLSRHFELSLHAEAQAKSEISLARSQALSDLVLFPPGGEAEED